MTVNFREMIQRQLNNLDTTTDNNSNEPKRKKDRIDIGRKHPFFGRILPLEEDNFPFTPYAEAWVDYTTKDGKQTMMRLILDLDENTGRLVDDDPLNNLLLKVMRYNNSYRKEHQNFTGDKIIINHKQADSPYAWRISNRAEFVAIPLAKNLQGKLQLKQNEESGYEFVNYSVSNAAYKSLLELTQSDTLMVNGKPFDTELGYITSKETLPVAVKLNSDGNKYDVQPSMMLLPPIEFDYLQRGEDGDYLFFDDPEIHNKPTKETSPGLYEQVLKQLTDSVNAQMESDKESQVNPYMAQQPEQQPTPAPAQAPSVAPASQAPVTRPVQPAQPAPSVKPQNASVQPVHPQQDNNTSVTPQPAQQAPVAPQPQAVAPNPVPQANAPVQPKPAQKPMTSLDDAVNSIGDDDLFSGDEEIDISTDDLPF